MTNLNEFMLCFRYAPGIESPDAETVQLVEQQWADFISDIALQGRLVSTYQLGMKGSVLQEDGTIQDGVCFAAGKTLGGNMVLKAENLAAAAALAGKCPILRMGGTVEVRDIIPMTL